MLQQTLGQQTLGWKVCTKLRGCLDPVRQVNPIKAMAWLYKLSCKLPNCQLQLNNKSPLKDLSVYGPHLGLVVIKCPLNKMGFHLNVLFYVTTEQHITELCTVLCEVKFYIDAALRQLHLVARPQLNSFSYSYLCILVVNRQLHRVIDILFSGK